MKRFFGNWAIKIFPWTLTAWAILMPSTVSACPLCVNATPYKDGLLIAVWFLLLVPFVLAYFLFGWLRRASQTEDISA